MFFLSAFLNQIDTFSNNKCILMLITVLWLSGYVLMRTSHISENYQEQLGKE